jgi:hypothetical protein
MALSPSHRVGTARPPDTAPCSPMRKPYTFISLMPTNTLNLISPPSFSRHMAAGIVHWGPPMQAMNRAAAMVADPSVNSYGPDEGLPALREALRRKIADENGLHGVRGGGKGEGREEGGKYGNLHLPCTAHCISICIHAMQS